MQNPESKQNGSSYFLILLLIWTVLGFLFLILEKDHSIFIWINNHHTPIGDFLFPYLTYIGTFPIIISSFILLLVFIPRFRTIKFAITFAICNLLPFFIVQILKTLFNRPRPLGYFENAAWIHKVAGQPENFHLSFPSGHSEGAFALFCFLSLVLPKRFGFIGILYFFIGLTVLFSRLYLAQHFYLDVLFGSIIGGYCCWFVFVLLQRTGLKIQ